MYAFGLEEQARAAMVERELEAQVFARAALAAPSAGPWRARLARRLVNIGLRLDPTAGEAAGPLSGPSLQHG